MSTRFVQLGELCDMDRRGLRPDASLVKQLPFVGVENIESGTGILNFGTGSRIGDQKSVAYRFDERHVLYAKIRPYLNKVATPRFVGRCSTELVPLLPREGVDRDFLAHLLRRKETVDFATASVTGARMPRTNMNQLMLMRVPFPPRKEQLRIIKILNRATHIEYLRAQAANRLQELIPAIFIKMFGDPVENPLRWEVEPLGDLILKGPKNGLYRPNSDYGSGTRILRINCFYGGYVTDPSTWQRVRINDSVARNYALTEDDIIVNRVNSRPFLGKSAIVPSIDEITVFESNMMRLTVNNERVQPKMLISMLQIDSTQQRLRLNAKDAINQASINQSDLRALPVIVPPLTLQNRFVAIVTAAQDIVPTAEAAAKTASALSRSLISSLLSTHL